jgi:hypothetical protein
VEACANLCYFGYDGTGSAPCELFSFDSATNGGTCHLGNMATNANKTVVNGVSDVYFAPGEFP